VLLRLAYLGVTTMVGAAATAASQRPTARALDRSDALRPGCIHRRYPRVVVSDRDPLQPTATALLDVLAGLDWSAVEGVRER